MELRLPYGLSDLEFRLLHIIIAAGFVIILSRYNDARTFFSFLCHVPLWSIQDLVLRYPGTLYARWRWRAFKPDINFYDTGVGNYKIYPQAAS